MIFIVDNECIFCFEFRIIKDRVFILSKKGINLF